MSPAWHALPESRLFFLFPYVKRNIKPIPHTVRSATGTIVAGMAMPFRPCGQGQPQTCGIYHTIFFRELYQDIDAGFSYQRAYLKTRFARIPMLDTDGHVRCHQQHHPARPG